MAGPRFYIDWGVDTSTFKIGVNAIDLVTIPLRGVARL